MISRARTIGLFAVLCLTVAGCGDGGHDNNNNDNHGGPTPRRTATPASPGVTAHTTVSVAPTPTTGGTPAAIPCPVRVTYIAEGNQADLDTGWTGIYHDTPVGVGGAITFAVQCPGPQLGACGTCNLTGPVQSTTTINNHRCVNDSSVICASDGDCPSGPCSFFFGPQVPVSAGGVPVCFTNRVAGPVTGTLSPEGGSGESSFPIIASIFNGISVEQPCPTCSGATLESTGTCSGGARDGMPCTVHGTTLHFGNMSFDCPASASGPACTGPTAPGGNTCWCEGQSERNACNDGVCTVGADGEGVCNAGPVDQICANQTFRVCTSNADCPASGDSCIMKTRECFGPTDASGQPSGPITRTGMASQTLPLQVGAFCLGQTNSPSVNTAGGYPGPGAIRLPTFVCIFEHCPSSPPTPTP